MQQFCFRFPVASGLLESGHNDSLTVVVLLVFHAMILHPSMLGRGGQDAAAGRSIARQIHWDEAFPRFLYSAQLTLPLAVVDCAEKIKNTPVQIFGHIIEAAKIKKNKSWLLSMEETKWLNQRDSHH